MKLNLILTQCARFVWTVGWTFLCLNGHALLANEIVKGDLGRNLDEYFSGLHEAGTDGAFLIAKKGEIVLSKGYGYADRNKHIPITPETIFDMGSITKQFTATGILKLQMQGKLSVTDSISKYFDNAPDAKKKITLHHLLTHTAGLPDNFGGDYTPISREKIIKKALDAGLISEPGTQFHYSNAGYSLLGAIIEIVSGLPYETYIHQNLFKPANMTQTGYAIPRWKPERLAHGYKKGILWGLNDWGTPLDHPWDTDGPYWNLRANGGMLSTVHDLYKWHLALENTDILSDQAKEKMPLQQNSWVSCGSGSFPRV